jgi:hypothetical protein
MREIIVIMELIMLILMKVQASDDPLQVPFPPSDLDNFVPSPLTGCLDAKLKSCEESQKQMRPIEYDRCIHITFENCFGKASREDPAYKLVKECYAFCYLFSEEVEHHPDINKLYLTCLKVYHKVFIKRHY